MPRRAERVGFGEELRALAAEGRVSDMGLEAASVPAIVSARLSSLPFDETRRIWPVVDLFVADRVVQARAMVVETRSDE
jgi:hypothetical protein